MATLFIDDERFPVDSSFVVVRSSAEAMDWVKANGIPQHICFDHDLGGDDTSMVFLKQLSEWMMDNWKTFPEGFSYGIHSQNPVGRENIKGWMTNMLRVFV